MNDNEFKAFLDLCNFEFGHKKAVLMTTYGIRNNGRWSFDQEAGKLQYFDKANNLIIESEVIPIGSYSAESNAWKWAWSNDSILPLLRQKAEKLNELEDFTNKEIFGHEHAFKIKNESKVWDLVAMSVKKLDATGGCKIPSTKNDTPTTFFAIMSVQEISKVSFDSLF